MKNKKLFIVVILSIILLICVSFAAILTKQDNRKATGNVDVTRDISTEVDIQEDKEATTFTSEEGNETIESAGREGESEIPKSPVSTEEETDNEDIATPTEEKETERTETESIENKETDLQQECEPIVGGADGEWGTPTPDD